MKRIVLSIALVLILISVHGQAPASFNYQAIVRDNTGHIIPSTAVSFRTSILEGDTLGPSVYTETFLTGTDEFGLVHLQIGQGLIISGDFAAIDWSSDKFFLKIEIDLYASGTFIEMGKTQLLSVPYSMFSETSGKTIDKQTIEEVLQEGNDANYKKVNNLIIGNCATCDLTTKGCIRYDPAEEKLQICNGEEWVDIITSAAGLPEDAVFVSPDGNDITGSGTKASPFRSIGHGIEVAVTDTKPLVLVANGLYNETISLENGISLLGGYDPVTWNRNIDATRTMISGTGYINNHSVTVIAISITQPTLFQGFIIYGREPVTPGYNSYAIYINSSDEDLLLSNNVIYSGTGSSGISGITGTNGISGANGTGRESNPAGYDVIITNSSNCNSSYNRQYNNGGVQSVGADNISGGNGGGNRCSPVSGTEYSGFDGSNGNAGEGPLGGAAGAGGDAGDDGGMNSSSCFIPGAPMTGSNGTDGTNGGNGSAGAGGLNSSASVVGGHWMGAAGSNGVTGGNGGGGGGGGAGGGGDCVASCTQERLGGHGGGGGSGGGGGVHGTGGTSGGSSFGIFIVNSTTPGITNTSVFLGKGSDGGGGGHAGAGGYGGSGGNGGICSDACWCYASAGKGGKGGNGGNGGGGGGGTGGSSYGIYTYNSVISPEYQSPANNNTFSGGQAGYGGPGGISYGNQGISGQNGLVLSCSYN